MKKKFFSIIMSLFLIMVLALPVAAQTIFVHDYANLLPGDRETELATVAQSIYDNYGVSPIILTTPGLYGQDGQQFADNFYENNRFGENRILFLVDMGSRQWYISTMGMTMDLISEKELTAIENKVVPYLSEDKYYDAFSKFFDLLPKYLESDGDAEVNFVVSLVSGAIIAGVIILIMKSTMNTKNAQRAASSYETDGSWHLRSNQDLFLYSNVTKQPKPQNNSSGSTINRGASGRTSGGRSGKF